MLFSVAILVIQTTFFTVSSAFSDPALSRYNATNVPHHATSIRSHPRYGSKHHKRTEESVVIMRAPPSNIYSSHSVNARYRFTHQLRTNVQPEEGGSEN
ncbi:hypothetical protein BASA82_000819 [Batrachochytrium salamandrivorans]|uniref:Secreted protein n=1 Tax=Batrachochytrium salamandrivorans TaxID=1357716 RepID=A0ABQ8FDG2_9FUNG|nr:hypothetical protein BASA62_006893 [Batrachochytrium salamandrivorans]KAH6570601.1 hypothetical protein BASA60_007619 [Batrachochytrium salamandrivorans]KAH6589681.1 hypothetical protein BASA61_005561 [Batrachochytrium salamandrivorans]KAH6594804.1 hypothetical protein BASA50_006278 [Batrachochytrium salamandrivorans]KAH9257422.1 hypothetical protein BASA81_004347 [Batrachochytrium salamandrivorans]